MSLLCLQNDMRAWLEQGSHRAARRFSASARNGLGIYQNNYRAQLINCLEESFAVTRSWLGGEAFHGAVVAHIEAVSPSSWTLDHYPREFPMTLGKLYPADPEVPDLALLELALGEAFVAGDAPPLARDLGAVDWDHARLAFLPSLTSHRLLSNAPAIWLAIASDVAPPPAQALPAAGGLVVWRSGEQCHFRALDPHELGAISFCREPGATFGMLCEAAGAHAAEQVGAWLGQWLSDAIIADIDDGIRNSPITRRTDS